MQNNVISADNAANAFKPAFTIIEPLIIAENRNTPLYKESNKLQTLEISCPSGWSFYCKSGVVASIGKTDLCNLSLKVTPDKLILSFIVKSGSFSDKMQIDGLMVQYKDGSDENADGHITLSKSTAKLKSKARPQILSSLFQIPGIASKIAFAQRPVSGSVNTALDQLAEINCLDQFGNITSNGLRSEEWVRIKLFSGTGRLTGTLVKNIGTSGSCGTSIFDDLKLSAAGNKKISANCPGLSFAITPEFLIAEEDNASLAEPEINPDWVCYNRVASFTSP